MTNRPGGEGISPESSSTYPYPTLPHSVHFEPKSQDSRFFAVSFRLPERGRVVDDLKGGMGIWSDAQAMFAASHFSGNFSGSLVVQHAGSTDVGTSCSSRFDGGVPSCPRERLEAYAGSRGLATYDPDRHIAFVAYYGVNQPGTEKAITISADSPIEDTRACEGRTRLFFTGPASPGDLANQTVSFRADGPAFVEMLEAPRGGYPRRVDVHNESGLVARYEPLQNLSSMERTGPYDWNETVTGTWTRETALGIPAGDWTITAIMDTADEAVSAMLIGVLDNPCFVAADGTLP